MVKNAGTAISNLSHSIFFSEADIKTPTIINAGAVTSEVTTLSNGEKNRANKKKPAATTAVNPDRPPTPTPAVDSTYEVDRKSTRLNSSHVAISYAVFCLKK